MRHQTQDRPLLEVLGFLLSPAPLNLGQPLLKLYLLPAGRWGWSVQGLVALTMAFHLLNGLLAARVGRLLGLSRWVAGSAAAVYLCLFAHFHAVLWPTASQHVVAVFSVLGLLWLYLHAEKLAAAGDPGWKSWFRAALAAAAVASLGRSALLAPALMIVHLAVTSAKPEQRVARFDRWLPLFGLFMIYPAVMFSFVGDVILNETIVRWPAPPLVKMAGLLALGAAGLALLRQSLRLSGKSARWLGFGLAAGIWLILVLKDQRQVMLPYNGLVPWVGLWTSFLDPVRSALWTDSTEPYHYLMAQISPWSVGLSLLAAGVFLAGPVRKEKGLWLLPAWYGICLIHLLNHYGSFPARVPSRYFIYLSPVFAWVICATGWQAAEMLGKKAGWSKELRKMVWVAALAFLCVANLAAIRLELFRGRLANTYLAYEEVKAAQALSEEPADYAAAGLQKLENPEEGAHQKAAQAFRQGVQRRPFLLRYLLGGSRLSDVRWITGERGLREWIGEVASKHTEWDGSASEKGARTRRVMDQELLDYAVCLLGLSYIEQAAGREDWAGHWISQLYFFERDPERLRSWLESDVRVQQRRYLLDALDLLEDPLLFGDPLPWRKNDYGFGRFMARLIGGRDIRSGYDRMGVVP